MGWVALKSVSAGASGPMGLNPHLADEFAHSTAPDLTAPNLSVRIHNLDEIGRAYGHGAALAASDHVEAFLKYQLRGREGFGLADYVLRQLSENPVTYDGQRFHVFVSLAPTGDSKDCAHKVLPTVYGNPAFPDDAWCLQYRADMALAVTLFEAMANDRLLLAWQPVCGADDPPVTLYHECLLRPDEPNTFGAGEAAGPVVAALERLGLVRTLDRHVVANAIAELRIEPFQTLGVNISALSLVDDAWWTDILASLAQLPRVARRLFLEVTETAPIPSVGEAAKLLGRLRALGCRVVLDDFGVGHAAIRSVLTLAPEFVKIDKFFLRSAHASAAGRRTLAHMIGLAESLGATAIVEGVETESDSRIAREAGAGWLQGYHYGRPSVSRIWRLGTGTLHDVGARWNNEELAGVPAAGISRAGGAPDAMGGGKYHSVASGTRPIAPDRYRAGKA